MLCPSRPPITLATTGFSIGLDRQGVEVNTQTLYIRYNLNPKP